MKKLIFLFVITSVMFLIVSSCTEKKDEPLVTSQPLLGMSWTMGYDSANFIVNNLYFMDCNTDTVGSITYACTGYDSNGNPLIQIFRGYNLNYKQCTANNVDNSTTFTFSKVSTNRFLMTAFEGGNIINECYYDYNPTTNNMVSETVMWVNGGTNLYLVLIYIKQGK